MVRPTRGSSGSRRSQAPPDAHEAALRLLARREYSEWELRSRLARRGFERDAIDGALAALQRAGLQDDERFARSLAAEAREGRGLAGPALRAALRRRGVGSDVADRAAGEDPADEEARAREIAARRARRLGSLAPEVRIRRLVGYLARRGFAPEVCRRIATENAGSEPEDLEAPPNR